MKKVNIIFVFFILVAITSVARPAAGFAIFEILKQFSNYMLGLVVSRIQMHAFEHLESFILADTNSQLENLRREVLERLDRLSNDLSAATLRIINELSVVMSANAKVTVLMQSLMDKIYQVETEEIQFRRMLEHKSNLSTHTFQSFVKDMIRPGINSLPGALENIIGLIRENHVGGFDESLVLVFISYLDSLTIPKHCGVITAQRQILYHLFSVLLDIQMRGYVMLSSGYSIMEELTNQSYYGEMKLLNTTFEEHMQSILKLFSTQFPFVSKFTYNCPPQDYIEGTNYAQVAGVIPVFIYNERDIYKYSDCVGACDPDTEYKLNRYVSDLAIKFKKRCTGKLKDCRPLSEQLNLCLANDPNHKQVMYKRPDATCDKRSPDFFNLKPWSYDFRPCGFCSCTCDTGNVPHYIYVDRIETVSPNYVVTGVRIVLENNTLYIQIQHGKLRPFGFIESSTIKWQPLPNYTIEKHPNKFRELNSTSSINMRCLEVDTPYVMTGVQFFMANNTEKLFNFLLIGREINLLNGTLAQNKSFHPIEKEIERINPSRDKALVNVNQDEKNVYPKTENHTLYISLGYSNVLEDFGQNVVPYFDIRNVTPSIPMPLRGMSLYYRTNANHAGLIAASLIAIDPTQYLGAFFYKNQTNVDV